MECSRCHFENVPGASRCLRCGAALVAPDNVSVEPPRAKRRSFAARVSVGFGVANRATVASSTKLNLVAKNLASSLWGRSPDAEPNLLKWLLFSIVPGLAQLWLRSVVSFLALFILWLFFIVMSLYYSWAVGLAVSVHTIAVADVLFIHCNWHVILRILAYPLLFVLVWLAVYMPAQGFMSRVACPYWVSGYVFTGSSWEADGGPGWLVLFSPWAHVGRGRVVRYYQKLRNYELVTGEHGQYVTFDSGMTAGRLLGLPGDVVSVANSSFSVNGVPIRDVQLLHSPPRGSGEWLKKLDGFSFTVPPNAFFVLSIANIGVGLDSFSKPEVLRSAFLDVCLIDKSDLSSTAFFILRPGDRMGWI